MLNFNQIKELIKEIDSSSLRVFELENSDIRLKLSKNEDNYLYKENDFNIDKNLTLVKSPLVGTYKSSSTPVGKPYVEVGSKVKKGDVLCIVEAMKIMNEITSDIDGEIIEVLRSDEEIIEFGMELFKIHS